jgi:phenylalanyl-tRNA synthetase beta chain
VAGGQRIGQVGEVHPQVVQRFDIEAAGVALFELDLESALGAMPPSRPVLQPPPVYPGALRDLALVLDIGVPADRVRQVIERQPLVARATLFDVYTGPQVGPGKRSLAYRVLLQRRDRTLTAEEVGRALERVMKALRDEVGAVQRG